jgi:hypothetical protein
MVNLFDEFSPANRRLKAWKKISRGAAAPFFRSILISFGLHLCLFLLFLVGSADLWRRVPADASSSEINKSVAIKEKALAQAWGSLQKKLPSGESLGEAIDQDKLKAFLSALLRFEFLSPELKEEELAAFYQSLLEGIIGSGFEPKNLDNRKITEEDLFALFNQLKNKEIETKRGQVFIPPSSPEAGAWLFLDRGRLETLRRLQQFVPNETKFSLQGNKVIVKRRYGLESIPAVYFFKSSPYEEILASGASLFYFVSGFPPLPFSPESPPVESAFPQTQPQEIFFQGHSLPLKLFLVADWPSFQKDKPSQGQPETEEREKALKQLLVEWPKILDEMVKLPEKEQLRLFFQRYLAPFDLNDSRIAALTEGFLTNNLNNVIIPINNISVAYDYLEELYFNKTFDREIIAFLRRHLQTRVGAEFLLYLASQYAFERRALNYLSQAYKEAKEFLIRRFLPAEIQDQMAKCFVVALIYEDCLAAARKQGYKSWFEVEADYLQAQMACYQYLINYHESYRDRGWYELGCFYWNVGEREKAKECWLQVGTNFPSRVWREIMEILTRTADTEKASKEIDNLFAATSDEDCRQLLARLLKAGRWESRARQAASQH